MEHIAFIIDHVYIYWSDIVILLAVLAAVCQFLGLYIGKGRYAAAFLCVLLAVPLSLVLSRLTCRYFRPESNGAALLGTFAGCLLTAIVLRLVRLARNLPELLDCMSIAGCLGIALGRLSCFFNADDRGMKFAGQAESFWISTVINPVSGAAEYRLATFLLQSVAAGMIFLLLILEKRRKNRRNGDTTLLFLLLYGAIQVVLDSTRYDALYFRSNGFVSVVQVTCAGAVGLVVILCAVQLILAGGWKRGYTLIFPVQAGCFALAGYMEYYVQRHGSEAVFAYSVMAVALLILVALTGTTAWLTQREQEKRELLIWKK